MPCVLVHPPDASYYDAGADGFEVDDELVRRRCCLGQCILPHSPPSHRISVPVPPSPATLLQDWSDDGSEEPPELALATHKRDRSLFGEFVRSFSDRRLPDDDTDSGPENEGQGARPVRVPVRNRPMVGATLRHIGTIGASANEECWEEPDTTTFMVRGANYIKDKVKVKSVPAIYAAVAADAFTSPQRLDHVMRRLRLPSPNIALGGPLLPPPGSPAAQLEGHLPRFLVINIQVPSYEPKLFGSPGNGSGINIVLVHELVANGSRIAPQARALVERFFRNEADPVTGEPTRERLKYIPRICNCEQVCVEAGLSRAEKTFMQTYDGKPVMTRPQHRFFRGPDEPGSGRDYLEIDIDAHAYSFVARRGVHAYRHLLDRMIMDSGFVLQGNVGEELPEQVLCACRVHHLDFHKERPPPDLGLLSQASQLSPGRRGVQEAGAVPPPEPASPAAGGGVARVLAAPAE